METGWQLRADRPIYLQLVEHLQLSILSGQLPPGGRVPPVRELAAEAGVNPNTMQRALQDLEQSGLVQTQRTSGRTVTQDAGMIDALRAQLARREVGAFLDSMTRLGMPARAAASLAADEAARREPQPPREG